LTELKFVNGIQIKVSTTLPNDKNIDNLATGEDAVISTLDQVTDQKVDQTSSKLSESKAVVTDSKASENEIKIQTQEDTQEKDKISNISAPLTKEQLKEAVKEQSDATKDNKENKENKDPVKDSQKEQQQKDIQKELKEKQAKDLAKENELKKAAALSAQAALKSKEEIMQIYALVTDKYFDKLFELLSLGGHIATKTWDLLMLLPTNQNLLNDIRSFQNGKVLLEMSSVFVLTYSLQIIEALISNTIDAKSENNEEDEKK